MRGYDAWKTRSSDDEYWLCFNDYQQEDDMPEEAKRIEPLVPALPTTPMEMVARAVAYNATPEVLEKLLAMQERWERNEARKAFSQAIAKARGEIGPIFKSAEARRGPAGSYRYETLDDIERQVVPALSKNGLSYRWNTRTPENKPDWVIVVCKVEHKDGHFEESSLGGPSDPSGAKNALQAISSSVTYLCRTTLKSALGLSTTTDTDSMPPDEAISDEGLLELHDKIKAAGQSIKRVCEFYKIKQLEDLPASLFDDAMRKLDEHIENRKSK